MTASFISKFAQLLRRAPRDSAYSTLRREIRALPAKRRCLPCTIEKSLPGVLTRGQLDAISPDGATVWTPVCPTPPGAPPPPFRPDGPTTADGGFAGAARHQGQRSGRRSGSRGVDRAWTYFDICRNTVGLQLISSFNPFFPPRISPFGPLLARETPAFSLLTAFLLHGILQNRGLL